MEPGSVQRQVRKCPYCAEEVKPAAVVCKHCGRRIVPPEWKALCDRWREMSQDERDTASAKFTPQQQLMFQASWRELGYENEGLAKPKRRLRLALLCFIVALAIAGGFGFFVSRAQRSRAAGRSSALPGAIGLPTEQRAAGDFRWSHWGDSISAVKEKEDGTVVGEGGLTAIVCKGEIAHHPSIIVYRFLANKLVSGGYLLDTAHANDNLTIDEFNELKSFLQEKYGKPATDKTIWSDTLYQDDPTRWGMAVVSGRLAFKSEWTAAATKILLTLQGDNFKSKLMLSYTSTKDEDLLMNALKQQAMDGM